MAESVRTESYRDLEGRGSHPWQRRALLVLLLVLPVLALLDVFGQRDEHATTAGQAADMTVSGPTKVRGGLLFQNKITVLAHRKLSQPKLVLNPAFLDGLTVNTIEPSASQELSRNGNLVLEYNEIPPGQHLTVWIQYQVNPTTNGPRTQRLELDDGASPLVSMTRHVRIFP
jgi:hypothetical protein